MKKIYLVVVLSLLFVGNTASAQSVDYATMLLRVQSIISELQSLQKDIAALSTSPTATAAVTNNPNIGQVLGAATDNLETLAVYGATNDTIEKIQKLLATDPEIYAYGVSSGFFGPKTEEAIKNLQGRFGMNQVGVVGPETAALLMSYFTAYPTGNYPVGVLKTRPATGAVLGASTSVTTPAVTTPTPAVSTNSNPIEAIYVKKDDGEAVIRVVYKNGKGVGVIADSTSVDDVVEAIMDKTGLSESNILAVLDKSDLKTSSSKTSSSKTTSSSDKSRANDALDDAEAAIDDAWDAVDEAEDNGDRTRDAEDLLNEAEDTLDDAWDAYDDGDFADAYDLAREARSLAREAENEL